jgi:hypothetical protein
MPTINRGAGCTVGSCFIIALQHPPYRLGPSAGKVKTFRPISDIDGAYQTMILKKTAANKSPPSRNGIDADWRRCAAGRTG